jgi:hypothetical protein
MRSSISRIIVGALLAGVSTTSALAAEPEASVTATASAPAAIASENSSVSPDFLTPETVEARAQHYRDLAVRYRAFGGVGYKAGLVQRAESDAAKYTALAIELRGPTGVAAPRSPEAEHYAQLAARYRQLGGVGYKAGLVQWAEAQERKYEMVAMSDAATTHTADHSCRSSKPIVCFRM